MIMVISKEITIYIVKTVDGKEKIFPTNKRATEAVELLKHFGIETELKREKRSFELN